MLSSHTLPVLARLTTSLTPVPFPRLSVPRTPSDRPLFFEFPHDTSLFEAQDAFMVGSALLVQPVVTAGATSAEVALRSDSTNSLRTNARARLDSSFMCSAPPESGAAMRKARLRE